MPYSLEFQISSLCFVIILNIVYFYKRKVKTAENQIYSILLIVTIALLVLDILSVLLIANRDVVPKWLVVTSAKAYIISLAIWATFWCRYAITLSFADSEDEKKMRKFIKIRKSAFLVGIVAVLAMIGLPIYYKGSGRFLYSYGPAAMVGYLYAASIIVFSVFYLLIYLRKIRIFRLLPIYSFVVFQGIAAALQFFNKSLLMLSFSCSVTVLLMYFTIENPDLDVIQELAEAKEKADAANRAKEHFLANISHEIRTPINAILGMNEIIIRESPSAVITEYADQIQIAGKTLIGIVNDVLDLSKIESGKVEIIPIEYDLAKLLSSTEELLIGKAEEKDLYLKLNVQKTMPHHLIGDEMRIKQILVNILNNAIKYTERGGVILRVSYWQATPEELAGVEQTDFILDKTKEENELLFGTFHMEIEDTGKGIKPEHIDKLFEAFNRLDERENRAIEGTGLGLGITSSLLELMGSQLKVESEYGKGSKFWFDLPQRVISMEPIGNYKENAKKPALNENVKKTSWIAPNARILVVDDVRVNLAVAKGLLKRTKMTIDTVLSGEACLEIVKENHYDIILMDHMMPQMDGVETFEKLQEYWYQEEKEPAVVIALTANAVVGVKEMFMKKGFQDYISKPIDSQALEEKIRKNLPKDMVIEQ